MVLAFYFYGGLNLLATMMIFFGLRETKSVALLTPSASFISLTISILHLDNAPSRNSTTYSQSPHCVSTAHVKWYLFWQKSVHLEPLYNLEGVVGDGKGTTAERHGDARPLPLPAPLPHPPSFSALFLRQEHTHTAHHPTVHTPIPLPANMPVSPFPALVIPSAEYLNHPSNQYARMGVPREGVCLMGGGHRR